MAPTFYADGGIGASARRALAAGADLVLITYDPDMFYTAMARLLVSGPLGLPRRALDRSQARLAATRQRLEALKGSRSVQVNRARRIFAKPVEPLVLRPSAVLGLDRGPELLTGSDR